MKYKCSYFLLCAFAVINASNANNITVSNVSLVNQNTANHTVMVQFTLSWQNSWRVSVVGPSNWDAAWVFVKYRKTSNWLHAQLNANANHIMPAGASVSTGLLFTLSPFHPTLNPGIGVFIYRSANGSGTFTVTNAQIQWMYGMNGLADNDAVDVQVYAIEMVYVPQGAFAVGDGSPPITFTITTINTSNATIAPSGTGSLGGQAGGYPTGQIAPDFPAFPNGFDDFYCMKYEISQQAYVDFLNTLDRTQQTSRVSTNIVAGTTTVTNRYVMSNTTTISFRNGIRCDASISFNGPVVFYCDYDGDGVGGESGDGRDIACNWLRWPDLAAYLDWSGLRPFSEFEFEKCARGNQLPVMGEYAWGNTTIIPATSIVNPGFNNEEPNSGAIANYDGSISGPLRVGCFAGSATGRQQSGAGYYGAMELTGNLHERAVDISDTVGRAFVGSHGNGLLSASGDFTNSDWPAPNATIGAGAKGGYFQGDFTISRRQTGISSTYQYYGGRGCRTAP